MRTLEHNHRLDDNVWQDCITTFHVPLLWLRQLQISSRLHVCIALHARSIISFILCTCLKYQVFCQAGPRIH